MSENKKIIAFLSVKVYENGDSDVELHGSEIPLIYMLNIALTKACLSSLKKLEDKNAIGQTE